MIGQQRPIKSMNQFPSSYSCMAGEEPPRTGHGGFVRWDSHRTKWGILQQAMFD